MIWTNEDEILLGIVRENLAELTEEARLSLEQSKAEDIGSGTARLTETTPLTFNVGPRPERESFPMTQNNSFIDNLNKTITEGKRIATVAHPLAADLVHASVQEDHDAQIEQKIAERADTAARLPEVLQKCRDIGDGLTFRESDADFAKRRDEGLRRYEQREQDRATAKQIASNIATLGT